MSTLEPDVGEAVTEVAAARQAMEEQIGSVIIGQREVIDEVLIALFARGHCLLVGVPGLAKTLLVRTLARTLDLKHHRIQFTPDLMPADITGAEILEEDPATRERRFRFEHGPIFTNVLLADEINRTPPKTQAALLEAMQEQQVTAGGATHDLPAPFLVLATQNPIEQEGTYPLPEAQLDRFMFSIHVGYPTAEEEEAILLATTTDEETAIQPVLAGEEILRLQHLVRSVPVSEHVARYASHLVRATRPGEDTSPDFINRWLRWGAGVRAGQYLLLAGKARAVLNGRTHVSCEDIRAYALPVLRHRVFPTFAAQSEGATPDSIITQLLETIKEPEY
ncbi:MAG: AAA family ATPase [Planctomycetota bacterium]|jgi:MoxR-like ATPase